MNVEQMWSKTVGVNSSCYEIITSLCTCMTDEPFVHKYYFINHRHNYRSNIATTSIIIKNKIECMLHDLNLPGHVQCGVLYGCKNINLK